jgi:hypothetical protein
MYQDRKIGAMRELTSEEVALVNGGEVETMWVSHYYYVDGVGQVFGYKLLKRDADTGRWFDTGLWKPAAEPNNVGGE